jgi:predicted kinase
MSDDAYFTLAITTEGDVGAPDIEQHIAFCAAAALVSPQWWRDRASGLPSQSRRQVVICVDGQERPEMTADEFEALYAPWNR